MNKNISTSLFLIFSFMAFGQCPSEIIYLRSQAEIDAFAITYPNCTQLNRGIEIEGNGITNLNGLNQIERIEEGLTINGADIENFSGLENLLYIGENLTLFGNAYIQNFNGLNQLEEIGGQFFIDFTDYLENFVVGVDIV